MVAAFDVDDVNSNPARFDQKKADAINAEHIRLLDRGRLHRTAARRTSSRTVTTPAWTTPEFAEAAALVQTRIVVLGDAWDLLKFLNDEVLRARREVGGEGTAAPMPCRCSTPR